MPTGSDMATASRTARTGTAEKPRRKSGERPRPKPPASVEAQEGRGRQAAIEKAKLDWESTADALAALVCLLGRKGQVMRTNRVVEDWSLGSVSSVIGKSAHALLHPGCRIQRCPLTGFFSTAMGEIRSGTRQQFELQEQIGARFLHFTIRPMRLRQGMEADRGDPRAV